MNKAKILGSRLNRVAAGESEEQNCEFVREGVGNSVLGLWGQV